MAPTKYHPHPSRNVVLAIIVGAAYLVLGVAGIYAGRAGEFRENDGIAVLKFFQVNQFQSLVHLGVAGSLLFAAWVGRSLARMVNVLVGLFCGCFAAIGVFLSDTPANLFALNGADNALHFVTALLLVGAAVVSDQAAMARRHAAWLSRLLTLRPRFPSAGQIPR